MIKKNCIVIFCWFGSLLLAEAQDLGSSERAFDIYDKPLLSSFFEEAFYPQPRQELVSTKNMYERKYVKPEIDMVYEMQRKEAYRQQQSEKYKESVNRFREKFNVEGNSSGARDRFRAESTITPIHPLHDPYMMNPRAGMTHPLYRSSFMRPGLYRGYGYGTQIETNLNKKEKEDND